MDHLKYNKKRNHFSKKIKNQELNNRIKILENYNKIEILKLIYKTTTKQVSKWQHLRLRWDSESQLKI